jgi:hypothetical protein
VSRFFPAARRLRGAVGLFALVVAVSPACGKKGPPLPPFSNVPGAPPDTSVRRKGDQVEIRFTVPAVNRDNRRPANIDRVEVYAVTSEAVSQAPARQPGAGGAGTPATLTPALVVKRGKLVGSVVVREPPPPPPEVKEGEPPPPPPPPRTDPGLDQGMAAVIVDTLSPADLEPTPIRELEKAKKREQEEQAKRTKGQQPQVLTPPDYGGAATKTPVRYYVAVGANGGNKGAPSQRFAVSVEPAPPAPPPPEVAVAEGHLELAWKAPDGLRRPILLTALPPKATVATPARAQATPDANPLGLADGGAAADDDADEDQEEDRESKVPPAEGGMDAPRAVTLQRTPRAEPPTPPTPPVAETDALPPGGQTAALAAQSIDGTPPVAGVATSAPNAAATASVLPARLLTALPNTTYTYAVYEVAPPNFTPAKQEAGAVPPFPNLLTPAATGTTFRDNRFEVGLERCYAVSTVATTGAVSAESPMSKPACVKTVDTFPPTAPTKLEAVASEGAISLIWEASPEPDVAGYLVLRGEAGGGRLSPLFKAPIKETTYRDVGVKPGVRYVYAVVAVDTATPHNVSQQSHHVEETAR